MNHPDFPSETAAYVSFRTPEAQAEYDAGFRRESTSPECIYGTPLEDRTKLLTRLRSSDNSRVGRTLVARYKLVEVVKLEDA